MTICLKQNLYSEKARKNFKRIIDSVLQSYWFFVTKTLLELRSFKYYLKTDALNLSVNITRKFSFRIFWEGHKIWKKIFLLILKIVFKWSSANKVFVTKKYLRSTLSIICPCCYFQYFDKLWKIFSWSKHDQIWSNMDIVSLGIPVHSDISLSPNLFWLLLTVHIRTGSFQNRF